MAAGTVLVTGRPGTSAAGWSPGCSTSSRPTTLRNVPWTGDVEVVQADAQDPAAAERAAVAA